MKSWRSKTTALVPLRQAQVLRLTRYSYRSRIDRHTEKNCSAGLVNSSRPVLVTRRALVRKAAYQASGVSRISASTARQPIRECIYETHDTPLLASSFHDDLSEFGIGDEPSGCGSLDFDWIENSGTRRFRYLEPEFLSLQRDTVQTAFFAQHDLTLGSDEVS